MVPITTTRQMAGEREVAQASLRVRDEQDLARARRELVSPYRVGSMAELLKEILDRLVASAARVGIRDLS